jgi:4-hydroxy-tetrahydrodipicolinate reductase
MIKFGVVGPLGRMGRVVAREISEDKECILSAVLLKKLDHADYSTPNVSLTDGIEEFVNLCDAVIDFSNPFTSLEIAANISKQNKVHVIGTTGFTPEQFIELKNHANVGGIFVQEYNMSYGINLLKNLVEKSARVLNDDFDIEILDVHHRYKKDAPSGTAFALGDAAAKGRNVVLSEVSEIERNGSNTMRKKGAIGFASIRAGDVIGDHEVIFANNSEVITLKHRALSRHIFAQGALVAAKWATGQNPGLYGMKDVLNL